VQGSSRFIAVPKWGMVKRLPRPVMLVGAFLAGVVAGGVLRPVRPSSPECDSGASVAPKELVAGGTPVSMAAGLRESASANRTEKGQGIRFASYNLRNYLPMSREVEGKKVLNAPKPATEVAVVVDS